MASVIERLSTQVVDGFIVHDDRPSTYERAEQLIGRRLDRRKNYAIIDGEVAEAAGWSQACLGCYDGPYIFEAKGSGCSECGYSGRRKQGQWLLLGSSPSV